ncbi:MAG: dTDP-4-dehydrorhamnose 3,5-epimerase [Geminicoccaceae bacterium]|nr:dTDP-4-dehydrorhamnose 3,5-epimerase [Geminicoccaceae bacterium]
MRVIEAPMAGVHLLEVERRGDARGYFGRCFCRTELEALGVDREIRQGNLSRSTRAGTLRGLHYQLPPAAETKIVQCLAGRVYDVVLDLRPTSATFGRHYGASLDADNGRMMVVPEGCAHGFLTLTDDCLVHYLVSAEYAPEAERGIRFDDPAFSIRWPMRPTLVSDRDRAHPPFDPAFHWPCAPGSPTGAEHAA